MAGVTDRPFRQLCKQLGAGYAVSEMSASNPRVWKTEKSSRRTNHEGEMEPKAVQIAGADPAMLAECARHNVANGAQIIDINMDEGMLESKEAMVRFLMLIAAEPDIAAVDVPVTLKFRTGWDRQNKNALNIARIAESAGIAMLTLHGRTRADGYKGDAEYDTIAEVKAAISLPVVANGDITTPEKAAYVLKVTGADAIMVGRAAQGRPWIFREIVHYLATGEHLPAPLVSEVRTLMEEHLLAHYAFYGEFMGVRTARKHIGWYVHDLVGGEPFRKEMNLIESCELQLQAVHHFFDSHVSERLQYRPAEIKLAA